MFGSIKVAPVKKTPGLHTVSVDGVEVGSCKWSEARQTWIATMPSGTVRTGFKALKQAAAYLLGMHFGHLSS